MANHTQDDTGCQDPQFCLQGPKNTYQTILVSRFDVAMSTFYKILSGHCMGMGEHHQGESEKADWWHDEV